jgi:2-oxoglutarate ferredoxin oxidoreductase subunit delta
MKKKKHVISARRCKSCGLCVDNCPKNALIIGHTLNENGNEVVENDPEKCVLCGLCRLVCPDVAIGVIEITTP